jgi:hypothetical protein
MELEISLGDGSLRSTIVYSFIRVANESKIRGFRGALVIVESKS